MQKLTNSLKKERKNIGLLGLDFQSGNLGCAALSFGFIEIIGKINSKYNGSIVDKIIVFNTLSQDTIKLIEEIAGVECISLKLERNLKFWKQINAFNKCDYIFDFTAGDSFSDIYGLNRFISRTVTKINVIHSKAKFVLGSQTYGPFKHFLSNYMAKYVLKKADYIFSRDSLSSATVNQLTGLNPIESVDVAFALPYCKKENSRDKLYVGFNPSGLLWSGGYNYTNQFDLNVNYKIYCCNIIEELLKNSDIEVYLIPHVLSNDMEYPDNDLIAIKELKELFPKVFLTPNFKTPMEAKSYIANMDLFIGARMHGTIAAFSSGVATIPFSYSRKFKGVFSHYNYHSIIDGQNLSTNEAVRLTLEYINQFKLLKQCVKDSEEKVLIDVECLIEKIEGILVTK